MNSDFDGLKEKLSVALKTPPTPEEIKKAAHDLAEEAANLVKKYPLQSLLGAVALGFILGKITNKKS